MNLKQRKHFQQRFNFRYLNHPSLVITHVNLLSHHKFLSQARRITLEIFSFNLIAVFNSYFKKHFTCSKKEVVVLLGDHKGF